MTTSRINETLKSPTLETWVQNGKLTRDQAMAMPKKQVKAYEKVHSQTRAIEGQKMTLTEALALTPMEIIILGSDLSERLLKKKPLEELRHISINQFDMLDKFFIKYVAKDLLSVDEVLGMNEATAERLDHRQLKWLTGTFGFSLQEISKLSDEEWAFVTTSTDVIEFMRDKSELSIMMGLTDTQRKALRSEGIRRLEDNGNITRQQILALNANGVENLDSLRIRRKVNCKEITINDAVCLSEQDRARIESDGATRNNISIRA